MVLRRASSAPSRRWAVSTVAGALAAIAIVACTVVATPTPFVTPTGSDQRTPANTERPSSTPTPVASGTAQTPEPNSIVSPGPYRVLQLPVDEIQIFSIDEELGTNFSMGRDAAWGPRIVFDSANDEYRGNLYLTDLTDGTLEVIAKAAGQDRAWTPDISGDRVAWVEFHYDDDRSFQGNSSWRLMLKDLASGDVRQIDSGVHTRLSGGAAPPAIIRIDGDHIAYAIEHKRPGYPLGWRIVLQSLTSGEVEREFDTELDIFKLDIAGASIAYSEGQTVLRPISGTARA